MSEVTTDSLAAMERMQARLKELEKAREKQTPSEIAKQAALDALDALGAQTVGQDSLVFEGMRFVLPAVMEGNLSEAIGFLEEVRNGDEEIHKFQRTYTYRPWDGANAFRLAMLRVFGTEGVGKATTTFFGRRPPEFITIPTGYGESRQVPWGKVGFAPLGATMWLLSDEDEDEDPLFSIAVEAPRKHRRRIEGFLDVIEDELKHRSIYRGKAIDASPNPGFLNPKNIDPNKVVYSNDVQEQLTANLWSVLRYSDNMRQLGIPLKRAVLLEGRYGTGKTLAGALTALEAVANGWTFILVRANDDPYAALKTAKIYAPAVVWIEDLDVLSAGKNRKEIGALLDALDGVQAKGAEVIAGFTTNFANTIDKGVLRPGRIDAVISIGALDRDGIEKLVRVLVPKRVLAPDVDFDKVGEAFSAFLPAFVAEAAQRSVRYSMARNGGNVRSITTEDLVAAAHGLKDQLELVEGAGEATHGKATIETLMQENVAAVASRMEVGGLPVRVQPANGSRK